MDYTKLFHITLPANSYIIEQQVHTVPACPLFQTPTYVFTCPGLSVGLEQICRSATLGNLRDTKRRSFPDLGTKVGPLTRWGPCKRTIIIIDICDRGLYGNGVK
jgi:hypothetical protein